MDPEDVPTLNARRLAIEKVYWQHWLPPMLLLEFAAADGRKVRLCDFGSAGEGGTPYISWLDVEHVDMDRPQFFTPSADERLRAEIARQSVMYSGYTPPGQAGHTRLLRLIDRWEPFVENC